MIEILAPRGLHEKGRAVIAAVRAGVPGAAVVHSPTGRAQWVIGWGPGAREQVAVCDKQVRCGRRYLGLDLGYWQRIGDDRHLRITVDACHPQARVMERDLPADRWEQSGLTVSNDHDPDGHVLIIGMGRKSREQFGFHGLMWEAKALQRVMASKYAKRRIVYRPKGDAHERLPGCQTMGKDKQGIREALKGAALVVCRHSNVAVDAILQGVPVACQDGAAAAICHADIDGARPLDDELRLRFLRNLAWWQWTAAEIRAGKMWEFVESLT